MVKCSDGCQVGNLTFDLTEICTETVLSEGWGWAVVLGFGAIFTLLTMVVSSYEMKATGQQVTSEHFNTAGRNVGAGLTAAVIVSQWTWAATLLQSSNVGWKYGVSGPFWYASGATVQILLFAMLAIQVKLRAPHMHTYLEVIKIRWGTTSHVVFIVFALLCNVIVTSMLLLGGAATIEDLTGMDKVWSSFLIPLGVLVYTFQGGLRATFFASYIHTTVIFTVLMIFGFSVYTGDTETLGSSAAVYTSLTKASLTFVTADIDAGTYPFAEGILDNGGLCYKTAEINGASIDEVAASIAEGTIVDNGHCSYSAGTAGPYHRKDDNGDIWSTTDCADDEICVPSYATMKSGGGLAFGIINIVGNFGTVFVDQAYWQSAIAAEPKSTVSGFLIGGMVWFAVPFFMATTFGLAGRSLSMGSQGLGIIATGDANAGLVPAKTIVETLGSGGAFMLLMQLFMAVTSTGSAEVIAVSSIMTYDLYWSYLNPELRDKVKEAKVKFDKALKEALGKNDEEFKKVTPDYKMEPEDCEKLVVALIASQWAKDTSKETAVKVAQSKGLQLFQVKQACVSELSGSSAYEGVILVRMSRFFTCVFAIFMGFLSVLLHVMGLNLGWVYQAMGNIIGSAVPPVAMAILSKEANGKWCTAAAIIGFVFAMFAWILKTSIDFSDDESPVSIDNMGALYPNLVGNLTAIGVSAVICIAGLFISPDKEFDWDKLNEIDVVDDVIPPAQEGEDKDTLEKDAKRANWQALVLTFILLIAWPAPQILSGGVYGKTGFGIWIGVAFLWALLGALVIIIMPPVEFIMKSKSAASSRP